MAIKNTILDSFYVIPGYTFFYWGFTIPKKHYDEFIEHFQFKEGQLVQDITIKINNFLKAFSVSYCLS
jgi:hypothetical protein